MGMSRNYEESLKVRLADSAYAKEYLTVALEEYEEDGNIEAFLLTIKDVANAQGRESQPCCRNDGKCS